MGRQPETNDESRPPPFWALTLEEAFARTGSSERGLSSSEAAMRLKRWGPNELSPARRFEALREIIRYLANPLVLILLVASGVSALFGQLTSSAIIALMVILSVAPQLHASLSLPACRARVAGARGAEGVGAA